MSVIRVDFSKRSKDLYFMIKNLRFDKNLDIKDESLRIRNNIHMIKSEIIRHNKMRII